MSEAPDACPIGREASGGAKKSKLAFHLGNFMEREGKNGILDRNVADGVFNKENTTMLTFDKLTFQD